MNPRLRAGHDLLVIINFLSVVTAVVGVGARTVVGGLGKGLFECRITCY